jgi:hypothetical protein
VSSAVANSMWLTTCDAVLFVHATERFTFNLVWCPNVFLVVGVI